MVSTHQAAVVNVNKPVNPYPAQKNQPTDVNRIKPSDTDTQKNSSRYRTTSLKELGKEKDIKPDTLYISQLNDAKSDFSQDDLVKRWIEYANSLTIEKIHLKNTLINCKPVLKENYSFEISVYNPSQRDEISDNHVSILAYLCNKLNNNHLKMNIRIAEKEEIEMIYTTAEKYDYLSKKNPNIEKLKNLFNLTVE